jgi:hypothetical protein
MNIAAGTFPAVFLWFLFETKMILLVVKMHSNFSKSRF